ncbi:MAG: VOC family protein [Ilumatobacteraceae bacterium]
MSGIRRLNHAVLYVSDARRSAAFYCGALDFTIVQEVADGRAVFVRAPGSDNHHDLGLFSIGDAPTAKGIGLYHLAWQVDTIDELAALRARLTDVGSLAGESDHGVSKSIYARDPDGIEFEVMWMVPESDWGDHATDAIVAPLDIGAEIARWSGVTTRV